MGSFQQISLGVVCLVAAFMFGNYVNNHPDPAQVSTAFDNSELNATTDADSLASVPSQAFQRAAPIEELQNSKSSRLPTMKLPNLFGMANPRTSPTKLPPPSQLEDVARSQSPTPPVKMPNLLEFRKRREVMIPDFSQLAAEFRNTPLELPPMQRLLGKETTVRSGPNLATNMAREWNPFVDHPTLSGPLDSNQFKAEDFTPKLKERFSANPDSQLQTNGSSTVPAMMSEPTRAPTTRTVVPPPSYAVDQDKVDSLRSRTEISGSSVQQEMRPRKIDVAAQQGIKPGWLNRDRENQVSPPIHQAAKPMIPFGLTPEAKSKLVRLRRPTQQQVDVGASRYEEHMTQPGDSLQNLSTKFYGRPDFYLDIYLANQHRLRNPASVPAGVMLRIPIFE